MALQTSGPISLNDIHVEAGGGSGTNCTINDTDIRDLISKGSGATMSFNEWYGASSQIIYAWEFKKDGTSSQYGSSEWYGYSDYSSSLGSNIVTPNFNVEVNGYTHLLFRCQPYLINGSGDESINIDLQLDTNFTATPTKTNVWTTLAARDVWRGNGISPGRSSSMSDLVRAASSATDFSYDAATRRARWRWTAINNHPWSGVAFNNGSGDLWCDEVTWT